MKTYAQRIMELAETYMPADRHFTSQAESNQVKEVLGLEDMGKFELQNMRDMVVMFFDSERLAGRLNEDAKQMKDAEIKMWSITAVIDEVKWVRGYTV